MKRLLVYASAHGCAESCAHKLKDGLPGDVDIVNLKNAKNLNVNAYATVLIGGSIHAGRVQRSVVKFCKAYEKELLTKKLGLFLCCMDEENAQAQFENAFPEALRNHAVARGLFGGAFDFTKLNFILKAIVKKVSGVTESVSNIKEDAIQKFIAELNG